MDLTREQFQGLRDKGLSVDQIIKFARGETPQQAANDFLPGRQQTEQMQQQRQESSLMTGNKLNVNNILSMLAQNTASGGGVLPGGQVGTAMLPLGIASERIESAAAAPAQAMQAGEFNPSKLIEESAKGLAGEKLTQFGDVYRNVGVPEWLAAPLGTLNMVALLHGGKKALDISTKAAKKVNFSKLKPATKAVADAQLNNIGETIYQKATGKLKEFDGLYDKVYDANKNITASSDTFAKVYNTAQGKLKTKIVNEYGLKLVDQSGRPMTDIANLRKLNTDLSGMLKKPDIIGKINPQEVLRVKTAVKNAILESLPQESAAKIKSLDAKFGPTIKSVKSVAKSVKPDPAGPVKTQYLVSKFDKVQFAGDRHFLRQLKDIDIDLTPEIAGIEKWIKHTAIKKGVKQGAVSVGKFAVLKNLLGGL